ncbi:MAG: chemotaxis protein CheA, partial [Nitrospinae bacterium]|nr:chemotaxis protein CheA [Nitrospinota bacterium]
IVNRFDDASSTKIYLDLFGQIWTDPEKLEDVTEAICAHIESVYQENSPERIYFQILYNIFNEFLEEISETLNRLDRQFVALEQDPSNTDCLTEIFRDLHTIKGSCGLLGLNNLESITHSGENLLGKLRDGHLNVEPVMITNLLKMMDAVWKTVDCLKQSGREGDVDYSSLINNLALLEKGETLPDSLSDETVDQDKPAPAPKPPEEESLQDQSNIAADTQGNDSEDSSKDNSEGKNIRVSVELLDSLMNLVGEVVLARNQFSRILHNNENSTIQGTSQSLSRVTTDLQETVLKARMQPIKNVWNKLPRMVRDLSIKCGNKVRLEMEGQDSELDKSLISAIQDPVMKIIRNAIVHGIETPEERRSMGKSEEGVIKLQALNQNGQIHIDIQDDGRSLNIQAIRNQAVIQKHITPDQAENLSEKDCGKLLFLKGFSLTENSLMKPAKGNGLTQTREMIEKIGGTLDIDIQPGIHTNLKIKIPLTLAIIPALIVSNNSNRYAIPQVNIKELLWLEGEQSLQQIEEISGSQFYRLRGNLLPLVQLSQALKTGSPEHRSDLNIVVLQADDISFGLVVEQIHNAEEIVVKNLDSFFKTIGIFSGATMLGDGEIVLILDVVGLSQNAMMVSSKKTELIKTETSSNDDEESQPMLIVSLNKDHRVAIRLSDVIRLEEVKNSDLEKSGTETVLQYRGELMPLINIPKFFNASDGEIRDNLEVVVHTHEGQSLGLIVKNILDIVHAKLSR